MSFSYVWFINTAYLTTWTPNGAVWLVAEPLPFPPKLFMGMLYLLLFVSAFLVHVLVCFLENTISILCEYLALVSFASLVSSVSIIMFTYNQHLPLILSCFHLWVFTPAPDFYKFFSRVILAKKMSLIIGVCIGLCQAVCTAVRF